ncbi:MAG: PRC-barrel domain-containing protein [Clostridia bacterium]|nr:PRC-barrel domain-containing protein [Clostridia bacterium]MCL6522288.1 PRC-barrel domain-containing protein [Bacillota bacterium]
MQTATWTGVVGLPLIDRKSGRRLGVVEDFLVSAPDGHVMGLLLDGRDRAGRQRVFPFEAVAGIGSGAVLTEQAEALLPVPDGRRLNELLARHRRLVGKPVIDERGEALGSVVDVAFDAASGRVTAIGVADGLWRELREGPRWLPAGEGSVWGEDAVILRAPAGPRAAEAGRSGYEEGGARG